MNGLITNDLTVKQAMEMFDLEGRIILLDRKTGRCRYEGRWTANEELEALYCDIQVSDIRCT